MNKKGLIIVATIILIGIVGLLVWKGGKNDGETIKIGVIIPLTGDVATYGQDLKKGMEIAFEEEDNFVPSYQDSKASQSVGLNAMQYLRNAEGIRFFIGDATTTVSLSIAEDAQKNGNILLVPIASGDDIKNKGDYIFMNCPRNEKQAISAAKYVADKYQGKRVGIIHQQIPYGIEISNNFASELQKQGMNVVFCESIQDIRTGLRSVISKAKTENLDVIFIPMEYEAGALVLKQCREQGITADFIGTDGSYSQKLLELAGDAAEGFCFTMFPINTTSDYYKSFCAKFKQKYNHDPNIFSCYGYESAKNMMYALSGAGKDPVAVRQFFCDSTFHSFTGPLRFDSTGEVEREFGMVRVVNGEFVSE